jgi:hypothetical protein
MDEEVEHMQWQLEQRSAPQQERSSRQRGQQRVFHGRSRHGRTRPAPDSSSSVDEAPDQQQQQGYHSMQLTPAATHDLRKTSERLAKHIATDGGCCVLASPAQASALMQLLLLQLQHKQLHRPGQHQQQLLLLQPLSRAGDAAAGSELSLSLFVAWMDAAALLSTAVFDEHSGNSGSSSGSRADSSSSHPSALSSTAGVGRQRRGRAVDALLHAAQATSTDAAGVLAAAADKAALQLLPVGAHSDPAAVAARILAAATADAAATSSGGTMLCLHVKDHAGAHAVAFTALALAADELAEQQHSPSLGVLLVPGWGRGTHVHATAPGDAALPTSQHHHSRAPDVSVEVASFGAAFYGLRPSREGTQLQQGGGGGGAASLQHTYDLEAWLCVLPL